LLFHLLVVAEGYVPVLSPKLIDPKAAPVTFRLKPHDLQRRSPGLVFKGRVFDEEAKPVPNAVVEPFGYRKGETGRFGGLAGFDELAVTNEKGEFWLGVPEPELELYVRVSAPFLAPRKFHKLRAGPKSNELRLTTGVTVTGRVVKNNKPVAGMAVGIVQKDRGAETFVGPFQAATDNRGVFRFSNVPPEDVFVLYGQMNSIRAHGAIAVKTVRTGPSRSEADVGDLALNPGHRLTGRVQLADGKLLPAETRVLLSRQEAWDSQTVEADEKGAFTFEGLPSEIYSLSTNVRGYHVSPQNASYDPLNRSSLLGVIASDIEGLRLLLEPGQPASRPTPRVQREELEEYIRRRSAPLRGAPEVDGGK
jgi:protocatechuate 3,4-dioxygenase beta subunit